MSPRTVKNTLQLTGLALLAWLMILVADATAIDTGQPLLQDQLKGVANIGIISMQNAANGAIAIVYPLRQMIALFVLVVVGGIAWWLTSTNDEAGPSIGQRWNARRTRQKTTHL